MDKRAAACKILLINVVGEEEDLSLIRLLLRDIQAGPDRSHLGIKDLHA